MASDIFDLDAYCRRIGYDGPRTPTMDVLRALCQRQSAALAFENLDPLLGRPVLLDLEALQTKLVHGRRGGYCFELNPLIQAALRALGFEVRTLAARVLLNAGPGTLTPRTHVLLRVTADGHDVLVDVGFGRMTPTGPLHFEPGLVQETPHERYRIDVAGEEYELRTEIAGSWTILYRFHLIEHFPIDLIVNSHFVSTHPSSFFTNSIVAARPALGGRHVLFNDRLVFQHLDGRRDERILPDADALIETFASVFGIAVPDERNLASRFQRMTSQS